MTALPPGLHSLDDSIAWANAKFHLNLPRQTDFPKGSTLFKIWAQMVKVTANPDKDTLFKVEGVTEFNMFAQVNAKKIYLELKKPQPMAISPSAAD